MGKLAIHFHFEIPGGHFDISRIVFSIHLEFDTDPWRLQASPGDLTSLILEEKQRKSIEEANVVNQDISLRES